MNKYGKTLIILITAILLAVFYIINNGYIYLYTNPNTNTKAFPYIAKTTGALNKIIYTASKLVNENDFDTKVTYTEAYGSGFLKNNIAPSDLDYAAGLYLGKFEYDGSNTPEIADEIIKITTLFEANLVNIIKTTSKSFYSEIITDSSILRVNKLDNKKTILTESLQKAFTGKPYEINIKNTVFEMSPYQVILPDYRYIKLFSKNIKYNEDYPEMLREITICMSYYADITDKSSGAQKRIHISTESFNGRRLQKETRLFVPSAFTNINSLSAARYFSKTAVENDLIQLENFFAHFKNGEDIENGETNPLKIVKRILQCTEILTPILPKETINEIHNASEEILSNKTLATLNDYLVAGNILRETAKSDKLLKTLEDKKEISTQILSMEKLLADMINDPALKYEELKPLFEYQKELSRAKNNSTLLLETIKNTSCDKYIFKLMAAKISTRAKFATYSKYFTEVMEVAGIHHTYLQPNKNGNVYILKDKNTTQLKNINTTKMQNGYNTRIYDKNTKFVLADKNIFSINDAEIYWYRNNPTQLQNAIYEDIKAHFAKQKKNYHIRINAGLIR